MIVQKDLLYVIVKIGLELISDVRNNNNCKCKKWSLQNNNNRKFSRIPTKHVAK